MANNIIQVPFDRAHEMLAYAKMGFSYQDIATMFGTKKWIAARLIENYANWLQKQLFEKHLEKLGVQVSVPADPNTKGPKDDGPRAG